MYGDNVAVTYSLPLPERTLNQEMQQLSDIDATLQASRLLVAGSK